MRDYLLVNTDRAPTFLSSKNDAEHSWVPLVQLGCRVVIYTGALFSPVRTDAFQVANQHCLHLLS